MNPELSSTDRPIDDLARNPLLGRLAEAIQPQIRNLLEGEDGVRRPIKDFLHGTFLGHPLHPLLTDVPIGSWTVTAVCDVLEIVGVTGYREAADISLAIGAAGASGAAMAGWADWSDSKDEPQRLGLLHAALNGGALSAYVASFIARRAGARRLGIALSLTGYGVMAAAAYLGGELSLGMQLGVKHTAIPIQPGDDFVRVCDEAAVPENGMKAGVADGIPLLLSRRPGGISAVSGVCTHRGAPLADGTYEDACVRCPWHGSRFALDDGHVVEGPASFPLADFETQVANGSVAVRPRR